jgi:acetyl-CoA C-acetyltransferase
MRLDPRAPVIAAVGQVSVGPAAGATYDRRPTPLDLMRDALEAALDDAGARGDLLGALDEVVAVTSFAWHPRDPARLLLETLGAPLCRTRLTPTGGSQPQRLVSESARRIRAGELDAIAIVGAEAMYAHRLARREGREVDWPDQAEDVPRPPLAGDSRPALTPDERAHGLTWPVEVYPLFENARRARLGWSIDEHRARLGAIGAAMARVASANPHAWIRDAPSATRIATPAPDNRMIGFPYTKLLVANLPVDMGACVVMTSYERARALGVANEKLVFPQCGADADDHWFVSERPRLDASPAMAAIWAALRAHGVEEAGLDLVDLYSCFPTVVQTACEVIGLDALDASRPPTVTGGLTFFGGPGNNYVTHAVATMVERLRERPTATGLVTGLGWYASEHAWGVYRASPPPRGFAWSSVQGEVDAQERVRTASGDGEAVVESYTVTHGDDGAVRRLIACARRPDGTRQWGHSDDPDLAAAGEEVELIGATVRLSDGRIVLL